MSNMSSILEGFNRTVEFYKQGEEVHSFAKTAPLPTFNQQAKWQFAKKDNQVQLHNPVDGVVYHFDLPSGLADEGVSEAYRSPDKTKNEFHSSEAHSAQVHRSDPGSIYFTVQEGNKNPTYTVRHVGGLKWHFVPKARSSKPETPKIPQSAQHVEQVKEAFLKIADAPWYDPVAAFGRASEGAVKGLAEIGRPNPWATAAVGAGAGLAYDQIKRNLYNTEEENQKETLGDRAKRVLIPGAAAGLVGKTLHGGLQNYYEGTAT